MAAVPAEDRVTIDAGYGVAGPQIDGVLAVIGDVTDRVTGSVE